MYATAGHDTASAVAAVPASATRDWAYISSGTWSLMGVETDAPVINADSLASNFTNEVGAGGRIRLLKNIAGLWLLQECRRAWALAGDEYTYEELSAMAENAAPTGAVLDPDAFLEPGDMPRRIVRHCGIAADPGTICRAILESLAATYARVLERLEGLTGAPHRTHPHRRRRLAQSGAESTGRERDRTYNRRRSGGGDCRGKHPGASHRSGRREGSRKRRGISCGDRSSSRRFMLRRQFIASALAAPFLAAAENRLIRNIGSDGAVNNPYGLKIGPDGALYICEIGSHCVSRLDLKTKQRTQVIGGQREPYELQFDPNGDLLFVDMPAHMVRRFNRKTGEVTTSREPASRASAAMAGLRPKPNCTTRTALRSIAMGVC